MLYLPPANIRQRFPRIFFDDLRFPIKTYWGFLGTWNFICYWEMLAFRNARITRILQGLLGFSELHPRDWTVGGGHQKGFDYFKEVKPTCAQWILIISWLTQSWVPLILSMVLCFAQSISFWCFGCGTFGPLPQNIFLGWLRRYWHHISILDGYLGFYFG